MNEDLKFFQEMAASIGIDVAEIERRLHYLEFSAQDETLLKALHDELARRGEREFFVEAFYQHLLTFPDTRRLIHDEAMLVRLKQSQGDYFDRLTAGQYDMDYMLNRLRIGVAHERVGLAPQWYIGAYSKYIMLLLPRIREYFGGDPERMWGTMVALLKIVSYDVGLAIDAYIHAIHRQIRDQSARLTLLSEAAVDIAASLSFEQVIEQVLSRGRRLARVKALSLALFDEDASAFRQRFSAGLSSHFEVSMRFRPGGLAEQVFQTGQYVLSNDRASSEHRLSELARGEGIQAILCLPLVSHARRIGVLYFYRYDHDGFTREEIELLTTFSHITASAVENAQLHLHAVDLASTDALTGLYNRRVLDERLNDEIQRTRRFGRAFSLLILDIDHFKKINDSHGHPFGDSVLQILAQILHRHLRDIDLVARYGGEEFVFILPSTDASGARLLAERIREAVSTADFPLPDGRKVSVTVSIGVASFEEGAESAAQLVAHADHALYTAKRNGRNRVCLYRDTLRAEIEGNPNRVADLLNQNLDHIGEIVLAIDMKAPFLCDHSNRTMRVATEFGMSLGLADTDIEALRLAAQLHDVGMVVVPEAVLNKSATLNGTEWDLVHEHPLTAAAILEQVPALRHLAPVVRSHHERFDGGGYPQGLKGEAIPYLARILSLADSYCALTTPRAQRRALTMQEVQGVLQAGRGLQFDPQLTDAFLRLLAERGSDLSPESPPL